jgi:hypothetical protein
MEGPPARNREVSNDEEGLGPSHVELLVQID